MAAERPMNFSVPDNLKKSPDPILGLSKLFEQDPREEKIDAGVGVFKDENGATFTPNAVKKAWKNLDIGPGDYLSPTGEEEFLGNREYLEGSARIAFGKETENLLEKKQIAAVGAPGGTGALAVILDAFAETNPGSPIMLSSPTWANHTQMAEARKIPIISYVHMENNEYAHDNFLNAIKESPEDSLVLFHTGKTHNPTGANPIFKRQWEELASVMEGRKALFDTPYAGFGDYLDLDTDPIRVFRKAEIPLAVALSYSKNAGRYNERPGALLVPMNNQKDAIELQRYLNSKARVAYSSPSAQGERVIASVLSSQELFNEWSDELIEASDILKERRKIFAQTMPEFDFVEGQSGLFSMLPLTREQVLQLRTDHAVYMPENGRVNFGGIPSKNIPRFAEAIKAVY